MIDSLSLIVAVVATSLMVAVSVAVLDAMVVKRAGLAMWIGWLSISVTSALGVLVMASTLDAPPLSASLMMLAMAWQIWTLRRRIIWSAHNGSRP